MENFEENEKPLVDDLGVKDLRKLIFGKHGKLFSASGRQLPVAELGQGELILHPPQNPLTEEGPTEDITIRVDSNGILLDELGALKKIVSAKYKGNQIYWLGETEPGTNKHYAGFLDHGELRKLYLEGQVVTTDIVYKFRNQSPDGNVTAKLEDLT